MPSNSPRRLPAPEVCPVCGEDVPRNALACKHCGADHNSGWREDADVYDGTDVPTDAFDYDDFIRQEFGASSGRRRPGFRSPHALHPLWILTALVLVVVFFIIYFGPYL